MSRTIVEAQKGTFDFAFSLLQQFVEVCPDELWTQKFGGWPIWQQVCHALSAIHFFIAAPGEAPVNPLVAPEIGSLSAIGDTPVSKNAVRTFAAQAKAEADNYMNTLADANLDAPAEGATSRMGRPTLHANIMALMSGHILYHLGSCDAALRERGLKGVF